MLDERELKRRRKRYKYALVKWTELGGWEDVPRISVERKDVLRAWWAGSHEVICDWEPEQVLRGMLKLLKENEE
jgi:hypothetical protein